MSLKLVNTAPGENSDPLNPGKPLQLGLKSTTSSVELGALNLRMGLSGLVFAGVVPETDPAIVANGAAVVIHTMENRHPIGADLSRGIFSSYLHVTADGTVNSKSITDIRIPIDPTASVLAFFQFKYSASWTSINPDWTNLTLCKGMVFGLEYGPGNNALTAFLHDDGGNGELVVGGPLLGYGIARQGQTHFAFPWKTFTDGESIQLFIYLNHYGSPTAYTPVFEIWAKRSVNTGPVLLGTLPWQSIGNFPNSSSVFDNFRLAPLNSAALFFGNVGAAGDVLELQDWALFPDYRVAVVEGITTPNHDMKILPDAPVEYHASQGALDKVKPGRWMKMAEGSIPVTSPYYQPGQKSTPFYTSIVKAYDILPTGYQKSEPRLTTLADGFMVEAFISAESDTRESDCVGSGFLVDDGVNVFKVLALENSDFKTWGILKDATNFNNLNLGYHLPQLNGAPAQIDYRGLRLLRLTVDRHRGFIYLDVDGQRLLTKTLGVDPIPATEHAGRVAFGHVHTTLSSGKLNVGFLSYLQRYLAYEASDALTPDTSAVAFTGNRSGVTSASLANGLLTLTKDDVVYGTYNYYSIAQAINERTGLQVDFSMQIQSYTDLYKTKFPPTGVVGVGVTAFLGNKKVVLGFYDCGIHGRKIGILPGSGTDSDIINQTDLGKAFSADADWGNLEEYRLIVKPFDSIRIYGSTFDTPILTIPWRDNTEGFDLPLDTTSASLAFGHFLDLTSSVTSWQYVRWGVSNGYELSVNQLFPSGLPSYLFNGKAFLSLDFDDTAHSGGP